MVHDHEWNIVVTNPISLITESRSYRQSSIHPKMQPCRSMGRSRMAVSADTAIQDFCLSSEIYEGVPNGAIASRLESLCKCWSCDSTKKTQQHPCSRGSSSLSFNMRPCRWSADGSTSKIFWTAFARLRATSIICGGPWVLGTDIYSLLRQELRSEAISWTTLQSLFLKTCNVKHKHKSP